MFCHGFVISYELYAKSHTIEPLGMFVGPCLSDQAIPWTTVSIDHSKFWDAGLSGGSQRVLGVRWPPRGTGGVVLWLTGVSWAASLRKASLERLEARPCSFAGPRWPRRLSLRECLKVIAPKCYSTSCVRSSYVRSSSLKAPAAPKRASSLGKAGAMGTP